VSNRIVCAANRYGGTVVLGARHFDTLMHNAIACLACFRGMSGLPDILPSKWEQGFINQRGDFLTRQEAWKVAQEAGQIILRVGGDDQDGGTLYSENLY
jgi:hypothetical protein